MTEVPIRPDHIDGLWPYLESVDWSEHWFKGLGLFHVFCALSTVLTRNYGQVQVIYFSILLLMVYTAEYLNEWAANNWKIFARQQYFDSGGLFISVVFSLPILFNCLVIVVLWLFNVGKLISDIRTIKQKSEIRQQKQEQDKKES
ncbi:hypothetical protein ScPMuIL_008007 [Solemya velum]